MYHNGEMDRYFRKSLKIYRQRRDLFCEILQSDFKNEITFRAPEGGLAVWANFSKKINLADMSRNALKKGLNIDDGIFYTNESFSSNGLRMGFASLEEKEMIKALGILKGVIKTT
jgi:GntR family transcriptional regulator/MocR family aminotransferase